MQQPEQQRAHLTHQWLAKADRDLLAAERALEGSPPLRDAATFHWQQAAEKPLKAYLTWHDQLFRRYHNLLYLVEECETVDLDFAQLREAAAELNPYSTEFRYPGDVEEPSSEAADRAGRVAREVVQFIKVHLPEDIHR